MTIKETAGFFKTLSNETDSKRERKIYKNFISILSCLESKELTVEQLSLIEDKIDTLNLSSKPTNKRKYFGKQLTIFKQYLKDEFSLISEGYYTAIGMSLGMCFGVAIGSGFSALGTSIGLSLGMLIGIVIGRYKDTEAEKENRVLKNSIPDA